MNRREYEWLRAELSTLNELLAETPEEAVIDRMSLESRKEDVEAELAAYPVPERWPLVGSITFRGDSVEGSRGIESGFGTSAFAEFADAVALAGASGVKELKYHGPIPDREDYSLLITGVGIGSFGFEFEEAGKRYLNASGPSPVEQGVEQVTAILKSSIGNPDELADAINDAHPRTLNKIRGFLKMMVDNQAVCAISFRDNSFSFPNVDVVKQSLDNLGKKNIDESEGEVAGHFTGYLPEERLAEFVDQETRGTITGRVSSAVPNAEEILDRRNRNVMIRLRVRRIGNARPRYTITEIEF